MSLLEMLLVVGLIAIASTLAAMVLTGGLDGIRLRAEAKQVAAQLRHARAQAIAKGEPQRFLIDPAGHRWQGADGRRGELPAQLAIEFTGARQVQPAAGVGAIVFFEDGGSTGGRIVLARRQARWQVDVAWLTGEVRLSRVQARP